MAVLALGRGFRSACDRSGALLTLSRIRPAIAAFFAALCLLFSSSDLAAQDRARDYLGKPPEWFRSAAGERIVENVLSYQSSAGSWPKNIDCTSSSYTGKREDLHGTFDNAATTDELRLLSLAYRATGENRYRDAFKKGFDHILQAQYANGGWPQLFPAGNGYARYITFNDGAMVRLMIFLRESAADEEVVDADRRRAALAAFDRGIDCILRCQVRVDGKLTVGALSMMSTISAPAPRARSSLPR